MNECNCTNSDDCQCELDTKSEISYDEEDFVSEKKQKKKFSWHKL